MLTPAKLAIRVILGTQGCWKSEKLAPGTSDFLFFSLFVKVGQMITGANLRIIIHLVRGSDPAATLSTKGMINTIIVRVESEIYIITFQIEGKRSTFVEVTMGNNYLVWAPKFHK